MRSKPATLPKCFKFSDYSDYENAPEVLRLSGRCSATMAATFKTTMAHPPGLSGEFPGPPQKPWGKSDRRRAAMPGADGPLSGRPSPAGGGPGAAGSPQTVASCGGMSPIWAGERAARGRGSRHVLDKMSRGIAWRLYHGCLRRKWARM